MKRASVMADWTEEQVPNYWLRGLRASRHLTKDRFARALSVAKLGEEMLAEPGTMVPLHREVAVVETLARLSDDPLFALRLGQTSLANTGSVLSYILFASPTLGVALRNICEFVALTRPRSSVEIVAGQSSFEFRMAHPAPNVQAAAFYREFVLASILHAWSVATNTRVQPERVFIALPIGSRRPVLASALGCPVEDAAGHTGIILKQTHGDLPIRSNDAQLLQHLTEYGRLLLVQSRPSRTSTRERVYRYLLRQVSLEVPRLARAAKDLGMSERTLSRRLADEGTSYLRLLDETRATMAEALLDDPSISVTEISYLLGFADPSSFTNAYRRWTGRPPISARMPRQVSA